MFVDIVCKQMAFSSIWNTVTNNKHVKYGLPFFTLLAVGLYGIRQFAQVKYEFRSVEQVDPYNFSEYGVKTKKRGEVTLETEYEKIKNIDIDNWENIRGPRLWDETPQGA